MDPVDRGSVKDVDQQQFTVAFAEFLKKTGKLDLPSGNWVDIVKLGIHKEMAPMDPDWFYTRCASIARHLYLRRAGVGGLTRVYGGLKRNGCRPSHFQKGSRSIARKCLQSLEKAKIVEKHATSGRALSQLGRRNMDTIAKQVAEKLARYERS
ncbi:unnamed protein product [Didymodactylos carnosus]|uniref:Small ribosomal subunit protein eS19 n=2 Tax=Didymodactylos carnosus TaxID=1234261 RepID=A0A813VFX7_9BILA|nr:unnamed protein product [Didymodactylos carnosus]CAF3630151.1 unnamed protein product [Didymodactylos carnosus]